MVVVSHSLKHFLFHQSVSRPSTSRASTHKARYALQLRVELTRVNSRTKPLERSGCETYVPRWECNWHSQGDSNPGSFDPYH
jgi:hypothetical protein